MFSRLPLSRLPSCVGATDAADRLRAALLRYRARYALLRYSLAEAPRYALQPREAALQLRYCVTTLASAL